MSEMNQKYQEHMENLQELIVPTDYIEYCMQNISQKPYDIVQLLMLSEIFDKSIVKDYIDNVGFTKSIDHYELLLTYEPKYFDLFIDNNPNEMTVMMDTCISKVTLICEYTQRVNFPESFYYSYFINKYNVSELESFYLDNRLFIQDKTAFYLFNLFNVKCSKDMELELFIECSDEKDSVDTVLSAKDDQIVALLKPETKKSYSGIFENVSSFFLSASKSLMDHSGKIALTSVMVMGIMATAQAGAGEKSFEDKVAHYNQILKDAQAQIQTSPGSKDCVLEIKEATGNKVGYKMIVTLGDEEKLIESTSYSNGKKDKFASSFAQFSVGSKKTGKCGSMAGDEEFKKMKETIVKTLSKL